MRDELQVSGQDLMCARRTDGQGAVAAEDATQNAAKKTASIAVAAGSLLVVGAEVGARAIALLGQVLLGRSGRTESDEEEGCDRSELHFDGSWWFVE